MSRGWWRAGHVTSSSPLIGPRTWKRRTKLRMEEQRRRPRGRGKDRVADVEDGLGDRAVNEPSRSFTVPVFY